MKKTSLRDTVTESLSLSELSNFCHADEAWIVELVNYGVLVPVERSADVWYFRSASISRAKKARRLHLDLGINVAGLAAMLDLLEERDTMKRRLALFEGA